MGIQQGVWPFLILAFLGNSVGAERGHVGCYYGTWAYTRPGLGEFWPEDLDVSLCDVIYYGFGNILNDTYEVCSWDPWFDMKMDDGADATIKNCVQERDGHTWPPGCYTDDNQEYCHYDGIRRTVALKERNPNLKVLFSVGGWTAGGWVFSQMASTPENRQKFIKSAVHFVKYFGLDGIDLDWEYPAFDMWPEVPTDKEHFTAPVKELRHAFDVDGYLLTFAAAPDPYKASNAYELDKIKDYVHWANLMAYDYAGPWDPFTGIDAPLYGRWGEGFVGHPKYGFNIHETIKHYLDSGFPADQIVMGIHTESKAWFLDDPVPASSGIYCPGVKSENMTYSRQEGWLYYYEILQFWHNETVEDPFWSDIVLGRDNWEIRDHESGSVDGCYLSPYMYQGKYWISYDDEGSMDVKVRYANEYGLKGAFVWEADNDNFFGGYGKEKFTILSAIRRSVDAGKGLEAHEKLGTANSAENKACPNQAPMCELEFTTPPPECLSGSDCNEDNGVICNDDYDNCFYCDTDAGTCNPGCSDDQNCAGETVCYGNHMCDDPGLPVITKITVKTKDCTGCQNGNEEDGLQIDLVGREGVKCSTNTLDNKDSHDYVANNVAIFESSKDDASPDDGLGGCDNFDLNIGLDAAKATWTGAGSWTPESDKPICVNFFGDNKPTCCCNLPQDSLSNSDGATDLSCQCFLR